jgi:integrase
MPAKGDRITKRKDGLFQGMYTAQTPDGPKRKYIYGRKYKDVERKLAEAMGDAAKGICFDDENQTVAQYMERWLEDSAKGDLGHRAYHNYRLQIRRHISPAFGRLKLSKLTAAHIQSLYAAKLRDGLKPSSVRYIHAVLHRALEQAVRFNLIPFNPAARVDPPKVRQEEIMPLDAEQARTFLSAASEADDRFECLHVLSLTVGLRMGEALGLKWSDIHLDAKTLRVSRQLQRMREGGGLVFGEPKNASRRTVDLPQRAVEALRSHRKRQIEEQLRAGSNWQDYGLVFASGKGTPLDAQNIVNRHFKPLLRRAGLPDIRWHDLRHTYATLLLARGTHPTYVQKSLGHASVQLTLDRYSHWMPSMGRATASAMDDALADKLTWSGSSRSR